MNRAAPARRPGRRPGSVRFWLVALCAAIAALLVSPGARSQQASAEDAGESCGEATCTVEELEGGEAEAATPPLAPPAERATLVFFWGIGCPHCDDAEPLVAALEREEPGIQIERVEVRKDPQGRRRFLATMRRLGVTAAGIPTFVAGERYVIGYAGGETDGQVRALVGEARGDASGRNRDASTTIQVPILGAIDPARVSLPWLTVVVGLIDGLNPCAIWVLLVLLGILVHVRSPRRMALYAGTFVAMSGAVYFAFMTAWVALFQLVGLSRPATMVLGAALMVMGLVNLKELFWFKKGPSLVIPDKAKPNLYRRMRAIANAAGTPAALGGIVALAFVVNLVELGCTLGLPAVYTRLLTLRHLEPAARYAYLVLYNVAYVVPLLLVVAAFVVLKKRITLGERAAKGLKVVSGVALTAFGALFVFAPQLLGAA